MATSKDIENVKQKLRHLRDLNEKLDQDGIMYDSIISIQSPHFDDVGGSKQKNPARLSKIERTVHKRMKLQKEIDETVDEIGKLEPEVEEMISTIEIPKLETIMTMRYVYCLKWKDIIYKTNDKVSADKIEKNYEIYHHNMMTQHGKALQIIADKANNIK